MIKDIWYPVSGFLDHLRTAHDILSTTSKI